MTPIIRHFFGHCSCFFIDGKEITIPETTICHIKLSFIKVEWYKNK